MSLKAYTKVGALSNLGDVRYCAGMGVDMIGFQVIPGHPDYLEPSRFQEIRGWVSGPLFVAEIYGLTDNEMLTGIIEDYKPDYLELGLDEAGHLGSYPLPYILRVLPGEKVPPLKVEPAWIISNELRDDSPVPVLLLTDTAERVTEHLNRSNAKGMAFKVGTQELSANGVHEIIGPLLEVLEED
jgi:phosphoribosylanthranilate isomerase